MLSFNLIRRFNLLLLAVIIAAATADHSNRYLTRTSSRRLDNYNVRKQVSSSMSDMSPVFRPQPLLPAPTSAARDPNVIMVPRLGLVRGEVDYKFIKNRGINAYLGLKYAVVGSGLGRFQKASKVPDTYGNAVIDATKEPINCPQFPDLENIKTMEANGENIDDCLTLNIFTPNKRGQFPVLVFVHGEMLFDGSAEEGQPDYLLEHDVVLVTINYRLAPFGYLTTLTDEMPGNVALADTQMALEWVQQHIRAFGGNADQVTLIGQAGGATLVHALSLNGKAQGLFHKLILQSGTALNPYFIDEDPLNTVRSFARLARCYLNTGNSLQDSISECFGKMSTSAILNIMQRHWDENEPRGLRFTGGFKLVIGDRFGYLPQNPAALVANTTYPLLAGVTKDAGAFIMSRAMFKDLKNLKSLNITDYLYAALSHVAQSRYHETWKNWALQHIFTADDIRSPSFERLAQGILELVNLILYRAPVIDSIRYTSRKYPTFLYCFDYRGEFHRFSHLRNPLPFEADATLSDDNIYLFPYPQEVSNLNPEDKTISRVMTTMWINFAQFNVPNLNPGVWPNVTTEFGPFVRFTNSKENTLELDYHFGEGIPIPNLYPEYFTTTTTTTTRRPWPNRPNYSNYPYPPSPGQSWTPSVPPPTQPPYLEHEVVLNSNNNQWPGYDYRRQQPYQPRNPYQQPSRSYSQEQDPNRNYPQRHE